MILVPRSVELEMYYRGGVFYKAWHEGCCISKNSVKYYSKLEKWQGEITSFCILFNSYTFSVGCRYFSTQSTCIVLHRVVWMILSA